MFSTLEVRWFYPGPVPAGLEAWYQTAGHPPTEQPARVDYYLHPRGRGGLGLKLREGRIEVKQRLEQHGAIGFQDRVAGMMERWGKWSFPLDRSGGSPEDWVRGAPAWVAVWKQRKLRRYRLTGDRQTAAAPITEWPERGCDLELVTVQVAGQVWWSLCLESFGDPATLFQNLLLVAVRTFATEPPFELDGDDSYGYVDWLTGLDPDHSP